MIFSSDALTCGQKAKCWWRFQAMDVCEQVLCLASFETTLCDRLRFCVPFFFFFLRHDVGLVLDGDEMCVKLGRVAAV